MTSSELNYLPKALPPNTITPQLTNLAMDANIQSITVLKHVCQTKLSQDKASKAGVII